MNTENVMNTQMNEHWIFYNIVSEYSSETKDGRCIKEGFWVH